MDDLSRSYTLIFLFNEDLTLLLLQKKNRGLYIDKWNGVGGHLKEGENILLGAVRETTEETGIQKPNLNYICSISFYTGTQLHCYCGIVNKEDVKQVEDEPLKWCKVKEIEMLPLAGDGNIPWLVNESLQILTKKENKNG